jgi:hypothetical protein
MFMITFLCLLPSNVAGVDFGKASLFRNKEKLQFATETEVTDAPRAATEEELKQQREQELTTLQTEAEELSARLQSLVAEASKYGKGALQLQARADALAAENAELEKAFKVRKRVLDLLPNADENIEKLKEAIDAGAQKLMKLGEKWETHRVALLDEYRKLKVSLTGAGVFAFVCSSLPNGDERRCDRSLIPPPCHHQYANVAFHFLASSHRQPPAMSRAKQSSSWRKYNRCARR